MKKKKQGEGEWKEEEQRGRASRAGKNQEEEERKRKQRGHDTKQYKMKNINTRTWSRKIEKKTRKGDGQEKLHKHCACEI
jgi:hypothetical protein